MLVHMPSVEACPIQIVIQHAINKEDLEIIKFRPCLDLSYSLRNMENLPINVRHIDAEMCHIQCSFATWRMLHVIIPFHLKHPSTLILFLNFGVGSSFKRLFLHSNDAMKTTIMFRTLSYVSLRTTFGGKSSCGFFSLFAELISDTMNDAFNANHLSELPCPSRCT